MASTAGAGTAKGFGFTAGQVVQEFGYDDDADPQVRAAIESETGEELVDEDYEDVADGAIIWWREGDADVDDLTDVLVDASSNLDDGGLIWVFTPKPGRPGHVQPAEIAEAAQTAGMNATSAASAAAAWLGMKVTARSRRH